jgi:hypothetical protein
MGHSSLKRLRGGSLGEGSFTGNPKDEVFERYAKCPVSRPPYL